MSRKVLLICCVALAHARTLETEHDPATAVSYSSIRFGSPSIEENTQPIGYVSTAPALESIRTEDSELKTYDQNPAKWSYTPEDSENPIRIPEGGSNNAKTAPTYTEAIFPQYVPSGSRVLNLAKPILASRNIPLSPSPEFDSVPTLLKTEGLSAYASFPIKDSTPGYYPAPANAKGSSSSAKVPLTQTVTVTSVQQSESHSSSSFPNQAQATKASNSEIPVVSHVSVISAGTNYSW